MKHQAIISLGVTLFLLGATTFPSKATSIAKSKLVREHFVADRDASAWSIGVFAADRNREVEHNRMKYDFETSSILAYLGYDVLPWLTAFGAAGTTESKFAGNAWADKDDSQAEFMIGLNANLIDQSILDPLLMEDRIGVHASAYISRGSGDWGSGDTDWTEFNIQATASIINDVRGNKIFWPEAISIFGGPVYSEIHSSEFDVENNFGFTAGMEIYFTERVSINAGLDNYDDSSFFAGLHVRF